MYFCCSSKSYKGKEGVNGGQEGILENFVAFVKIVSKAIRMVEELRSDWY
jgi:hypothetical protein